jgi:type IV pilus assembly protein PilC
LFQLEMLVRAGVPILDSLADLRDASESPGAIWLAGLFEKIEAGSTLGEAVANYPGVFSETVVNLIRSGEVTGQLPDVLQGDRPLPQVAGRDGRRRPRSC